MKWSRGFTLAELVLTIIIVGIIAVYAAPRMNPQSFDARIAAQELVEAIRYAQTMSMNNSGADPFRINIAGNGYSVTQNGTPVTSPLTGAPYTDDDWSGQGIGTDTTMSIFFNSRGRPYVAVDTPLTSNPVIQVTAGGNTINVRLEQLTGYARVL
jgi:MSHA pilin protein MshC